MRIAKIKNGKVVNVLEVSNIDDWESGWIKVPDNVGIGWMQSGDTFEPPPRIEPPQPPMATLRDLAFDELRRKRDAMLEDADGGQLFLRYLTLNAAGRQQMETQAIALKTRFLDAKAAIYQATTREELKNILENF